MAPYNDQKEFDQEEKMFDLNEKVHTAVLRIGESEVK
jgi:hypothetical protein